ncbi:MFS transporter [Thermophilibacter provencensis]|uniref:MFS transporter n=1 Tax=Thermophilibacter provencensis TaxID=1852386 RepID=UPI0023541400|nr:MFS transporter [Thermophilibacter provencensis]
MLVTRDGAVLLAATFCYLASTMLANPLVAGFAGTLGATAAMMGVLTALMNACSLVVRPVAGNLSDRLPKRHLAAAGAALMLVTALGQALAPNTVLLAAMRLANGAGYSLCSVCMSTWFAETLPPARLGQGMGIFGLMNALGMAVGPALGIAVSDALGYRLALGVSAAFAALALVGILLVRGEAPARGEKGEKDARPAPRLRLLDRRAVPAAVVVALFTIPYMATQSFLVSYAEARGLDVPTGAFFTVYAAALMALRVLLGRAFDRVGFVPFVVASGASSVASLVLLATMTDAVGLLLAAPFMAGGYGVMCSVCQSTAVRAVGPEHVGLANSTYYMGFDVGMTLGPVIGGALFGAVDLAWFFPALTLAAPAAVAVAALSAAAGRDRRASKRNREM